jgi:shikimate dehydrogenase
MSDHHTTDFPLVTGATKLIFIVGHPVEQVKLPGSLNRFLGSRFLGSQSSGSQSQRDGLDVVMVPADVSPDKFDAFIETLRGLENCLGAVATIPYKGRAAAVADHCSRRVDLLGVANVLRRDEDGTLHAEMTDGIGFVEAARHNGARLTGGSALLVGAGGAGSAIALSLAEAGLANLAISEPDQAKAKALASLLAKAMPGMTIGFDVPEPEALDLAINASPIGMSIYPGLPLKLPRICTHTLFAEVVTSPEITPWLADAQAAGAKIQLGREMAAWQAPAIGAFLGLDMRGFV